MTTAYQNVDIPRDRWGRPMVMQPGGKKRLPYRRTTTFVGVLDDMNGLMKWKSRQVALGMGQRKDLVLAAAAARPDDKKTLGDIAEAAAEHAKSSSAATTGTALHTLTERIDQGETIGEIPAEYQADLDAYRAATEHIEWVGIESFRVHDDWQVAGTADRIGRFPGDDRLRIFDIKTGSIDYPGKMCMQLAMYARMTPYDITTDTRTADPGEVDLNTGIIIHLPAGQGVCTLHEIDLMKGWGACLLARQVWDWRSTKGLTHQIGTERKSTWEIAQRRNDKTDRRDAFTQTFFGQNFDEYTESLGEAAILDAGSVEQLRDIWRELKENNRLTPRIKSIAEKRAEELK